MNTPTGNSDGFQNTKKAKFLINTTASSTNAICVYYSQNSNKLYPKNDTNTTWPGGYTPGSPNTIENNYGKLDCGATSVSGSGTTVTINWSITPKTTMSGKTYNTYLYAKDDAYASTGWKKRGTWGVL